MRQLKLNKTGNIILLLITVIMKIVTKIAMYSGFPNILGIYFYSKFQSKWFINF